MAQIIITQSLSTCNRRNHNSLIYCKLVTEGTVTLFLNIFVNRLVTEEDAVRIYHSLENERLYHGKDPQFIEISAEVGFSSFDFSSPEP